MAHGLSRSTRYTQSLPEASQGTMARSSSASRACVLFRQMPVKKDASSATSWEVMYLLFTFAENDSVSIIQHLNEFFYCERENRGGFCRNIFFLARSSSAVMGLTLNQPSVIRSRRVKDHAFSHHHLRRGIGFMNRCLHAQCGWRKRRQAGLRARAGHQKERGKPGRWPNETKAS